MCPPTSLPSDLPRKTANPKGIHTGKLIDLTNQILELTKAVHAHTVAAQSVKQ
jgi:hypothetical protein